MASHYQRGKLLGIQEQHRTNRNTGEVITKYYVVLTKPRFNGLDGQMEEAQYFLTNAQVEKGVLQKLEDFIGKPVEFEVFNMIDAFKSRAGEAKYTERWYLGGDAVPRVLQTAAK